MKHPQNYLWLSVLTASILALTGCLTTRQTAAYKSADENTPFAPPTALTGVATNGNVVLHWQNHATAEGGVWIEYTTPGTEDYIKVDAFGSDSGETSFVHPNVATGTQFIYRLQPFFGRTTKPAGITTGTVLSTNEPVLMAGPIDPTNAPPTGPQYSLRSIATFTNAMPTELTTTLSSPTSVDVRWKDNASDEDGYLLEISAHADEAFVPCALLPASTTSFRKTELPSQTQCYFRVRAFFYTKPTDTVSATTP
ncbi:MAG TPA: fibronectin type III domain-containing protein [Desulfuromonadaceae bacterium]|nr:fibronectin type III domain-containing protein [Desulfuromonadaceae bacterium]